MQIRSLNEAEHDVCSEEDEETGEGTLENIQTKSQFVVYVVDHTTKTVHLTELRLVELQFPPVICEAAIFPLHADQLYSETMEYTAGSGRKLVRRQR